MNKRIRIRTGINLSIVEVYTWTCNRNRDNLDYSIGTAGFSWPRREWWLWLRRQQLTSHGVLPPSLLDHWRHSIRTAADISGFTNKYWPNRSRPTTVCTAHSAYYRGDGWWQILRPAEQVDACPTLGKKNCPKFFVLHARVYSNYFWMLFCFCWKILNAAYHVGISPSTGTSFVKTLIEKMKQVSTLCVCGL